MQIYERFTTRVAMAGLSLARSTGKQAMARNLFFAGMLADSAITPAKLTHHR